MVTSVLREVVITTGKATVLCNDDAAQARARVVVGDRTSSRVRRSMSTLRITVPCLMTAADATWRTVGVFHERRRHLLSTVEGDPSPPHGRCAPT